MLERSGPPERRMFDRALAKFDVVVQQVPDDAWSNQSPCAEWTAAHVVGHVAATVQLPVFLGRRIPLLSLIHISEPTRQARISYGGVLV